MNQVPSRQQNRRSARFIAVLAISAAVLITGTAGYASVKADAVGTATSSVYGSSHLNAPLTASSFMAPLTSASVNTMATTVTLTLSLVPTYMGPLAIG